MFKKLKKWLKRENDRLCITVEDAWQYSKLIEKFPLNGKISDDDILHVSHKNENGEYETCFITIAQLKEVLKA
jgi:hypothetical protein